MIDPNDISGGGINPLMLDAGALSQQQMETEDPNATPLSLPLTPHKVTGTVPKKNSSTLPPEPRLKKYPDSFSGPFVVFFRPKGKRLNTSQITKDLTKRFSSVISIDMVGTNKLRVEVSDRKQANEIASYELFTLEYHVYLPSHVVEIVGVVSDASMTCAEILQGCGRFRNHSLPSVEILHCRQLQSVSQNGDERVYSPSSSFAVTFSGTALPDYVVMDKLRLPVRLYVPKVMNCTKCKQLGHTAQFCCNKPRCAKCGEKHVDDACQKEPKCVYCDATGPPHALNECPTYIQRRDHQKRSLKQRSRRSYAEMLKQVTPLVESKNVYSSLSLDDQGSDSEVGDGIPFVFKGSTRKRMRAQKPIKTPRKLPRSDPQPKVNPPKAGRSAPKRSPPGFNVRDERHFPSLSGATNVPDDPVLPNPMPERKQAEREEQPQGAAMFTLSGIVDMMLNFFNASDPVRNLVKGLLPCITPFLKQLTSKMPLLATIVSFDG